MKKLLKLSIVRLFAFVAIALVGLAPQSRADGQSVVINVTIDRACLRNLSLADLREPAVAIFGSDSFGSPVYVLDGGISIDQDGNGQATFEVILDLDPPSHYGICFSAIGPDGSIWSATTDNRLDLGPYNEFNLCPSKKSFGAQIYPSQGGV